MNKATLRICAQTVLFLLLASAVGAEDRDRKIAALEGRVADLEAHNRELLALLREIERRLPRGEEAVPRPVRAALRTAAPQAQSSGSESRTPKEIEVGDSRLGFYGFVRLDAIYDDSRSSAIQTPTFIPAEDPALGTGDSDASFNFHPRLTRFGMSYDGPELGASGAKLSGKIEIDFQNGGRESRQVIRMRHGYLQLDWGKTSLLAGQTWDLVSPLYPTVNSDTLMWNAGNLGDRRPQVRVRVAGETGFSFEGGIGVSGAISPTDLDGDGVRDGDDAAVPNFQTRLGYAGESWELGLSGHFGREETTTEIAGEDRFDSSSVSLDFKGEAGRLTVLGELWSGENLDDFRGGIGQGVNAATGEEIASEGGWLELGLELSRIYSLHVGYTIDDPDDGDVPAGGRIKNEAWYLVQRFRFGRPFLLGFDYLYWTTEHQGLADGTDNRFNLYLVYTF